MSGKRQPELTEGQKACLRLVNDHRTSKEIARILGISPFTVDQRLDAARRKMNASSRAEAARLFALAEEGQISDPLVYDAGAIVGGRTSAIPMSPSSQTGRVGMTTEFVSLGPDQPAMIDRKNLLQKLFSFMPVPPAGGERHEFTKREILFQSLNVAFFSVLVLAIIVLILTGAMRMFR